MKRDAICPHCRKPLPADHAELDLDSETKPWAQPNAEVFNMPAVAESRQELADALRRMKEAA